MPDSRFAQFGIYASILLASYAFYKLYITPYYLSSIRHLPGPPRKSIILGNLPEIVAAEPGILQKEWLDKYGGYARYHFMFGVSRLLLSDVKAVNHILLSNPYSYPKPNALRGELAKILGKGLLFAEGDDHKRQRKIMTPAFTWPHVRELTPVFQAKARIMLSQWLDAVATEAESAEPKGYAIFDVSLGLNRCTLDVIGKAGLGYEFGSLENDDNALAKSFQSMTKSLGEPSVLSFAMMFVVRALPFLALIPNKRVEVMRESMRIRARESRKIFDEKKKVEQERMEKSDSSVKGARDLMSLLVRSNLDSSLKARDRMDDDEVMSQMTTFLLAGQETTSTAATWTLLRLAQNPEIQTRLRAEIVEAQAEAERQGLAEIEPETLEKLPYLDAICKEIMRFDSPVSGTIRGVAKEDHIPVSTPYRLPNGEMTDTIHVMPGQSIFMSIYTINRNETIWGPDASKFNPDRWFNLPESVADGTKGFLWAHQLSFLSGSRACIGWRFAVLELKAIISVAIQHCSFAERDEGGTEIYARSFLVSKPLVRGEAKAGTQLPLRVSRVQKAQ
ncbi:uncharacterized protein L969DRAFT_97442 [Mixia osmundae IAM 14324]|uniref:Cytochrome P450 n=1 Tax=Mixia osmundae (strain CBS 9802 / IAM 14324 / JCM 22182 / KY 12970) TaxID=764103 RepID=G7E4I4_MIXOS|nr:uncharacterized protein L969DRAFT_97442 [Mixia osmundae IAM 14324]KEI36239.1 hypothetical protein L969DRAFT_97442 [Mixia osmundae IAM 14324]GAA97744.1 hypothetical protein E5Q_04423 [Mixia osmundae IAM 14324]